MPLLVIGGTGTVGSHVVASLAQQGVPVRCMTRWEASLQSLPQGVEGRIGDLNKPATLRPVFSDIETMFLITPLSQNETLQGLAAVDVAKAAGIKKIVYMSVPMPPGSDHIPHFRSKVPIEEAIRDSGCAYTILRPNNFYQNDHWCQAAIMVYNTYPQPIGSVGLNRVDARDIADAAVTALTGTQHEGEEYTLHGPETMTGDDVAKVFGRHLGREITYGGDDLDAWAKQSQHMMPAWMVQDLRIMYQYFQQHGLVATEDELARQRSIVGHEPRDFDTFVDEILPVWQERMQEGKQHH